MQYANATIKWKTCIRTCVILYARLHMQFPNAKKRMAPCSDWCETDFLIQPSDLSVQAGLPKKNRSEGKSEVRKTWIPPCRIWNLGFRHSRHSQGALHHGLYVDL